MFATYAVLLALTQGATDPSLDSRGLDRLRDAYVAAYNTGDATAMQTFYVDSAVRLPYDAPAERGRAAVVEAYQRSFAARRWDPTLRLVPSSVEIRGTRALEWGLYHERMVPRSPAPPFEENGKYLTIAERDGQGRWRYVWSMFNRDSAAAVVRSGVAQQASPSSACTAPEYRQFDFWVGDWDVFDPSGARAGTNRIDRQFGGCVVQEHWVGASGGVGSSFNTYSPGTKQWHQTWVDNQGSLLLLDGSFANGAMTLSGRVTRADGSMTLHRIRWSLIGGDANRVRQLWESSADGGKSWTVAFDGTYVRKGSR